MANALDYCSREDEAIPLYEQAIQMGLTVEYEAYALLQLGSSLRNVGRVREAVQTLTEAERRYPQFPALSAALKTALTAMIRHIPSSDIKRYAGALDTYVAALK